MATELIDIELDEVSFVDRGANLDEETGEGAHVVLWKRDINQEADMPDEKIGIVRRFLKELGVDGYETEETTEEETIEEEVETEEVTEEPEETTEEVETEEAEEPEAEEEPEEVETVEEETEKSEELQKALEEKAELENQIQKLETEKAEAEELAKAEAEKVELAKFVKRAEEGFPALSGKPEAKGALLKTLHATLSDEDFKTVEGWLKSAQTFADQAKAFESVGKDGVPDEETALGKINRIAKDLVEAGEFKTIHAAVSHIISTNKELAAQYKAER